MPTILDRFDELLFDGEVRASRSPPMAQIDVDVLASFSLWVRGAVRQCSAKAFADLASPGFSWLPVGGGPEICPAG